MSTLHLVGTIHRDPAGYSALQALLLLYQPRRITVEVSSYAIAYRQKYGPMLMEALAPFRRSDGTLPPGLEPVAAQIAIPFEYSAVRDYAEKNNVMVYPVGDSEISKTLLATLEHEVLAPDNLSVLAGEGHPGLADLVQLERERARRHFLQGPPLDSADREWLGAMDRFLADAIHAHSGKQTLVHVGGWEHLAGLSRELARQAPVVELL